MPVFIHCGAMRQEETIALIKHACRIGADGHPQHCPVTAVKDGKLPILNLKVINRPVNICKTVLNAHNIGTALCYFFCCLCTDTFQKDGEVDLNGMRQLTRMLVDKGIHCLYPCGTTGEMLRLSMEERMSILLNCY